MSILIPALHHNQHIVHQLKVLILHERDGFDILPWSWRYDLTSILASNIPLYIHKFGQVLHAIQQILHLLTEGHCNGLVLLEGKLFWACFHRWGLRPIIQVALLYWLIYFYIIQWMLFVFILRRTQCSRSLHKYLYHRLENLEHHFS
jgi:hypothetical protein